MPPDLPTHASSQQGRHHAAPFSTVPLIPPGDPHDSANGGVLVASSGCARRRDWVSDFGSGVSQSLIGLGTVVSGLGERGGVGI